ncbi:uncharacterized protein LOC131801727 [Musca domestica]|uniref:Uncharacterized protein LOC131801727 n=1 Tax=Musca domestica TaxID=7370 RepID=A0ABM3USZ3_MUSDO|nr:uncharacterized protein LOC131801727 [Musca domestica]
MNYQRILRIASGYLLFTGYQIRTLDVKSQRYRVSLWSVLYFVGLLVIYLICFGHHFEESALLKITFDLSPFLKHLLLFQIWLGLKTFVFCMIEWTFLTKVFNGLLAVLVGTKAPQNASTAKKVIREELLTYLIFFSTLLVAFAFGLYIAIEMKFVLPPMDHIMIALALFIPHFMVAGALRFHTLSLWLLRTKLSEYKDQLIIQDPISQKSNVIVEIINPVLKKDLEENRNPNEGFSSMDEIIKNDELEVNKTPVEDITPMDIYRYVSEGVNGIARYLSSTNKILQRQLLILNGLNYNCLLYGIYTKLYFEKSWHLIFTDRNRRVFYAANSVIFVCIFLDYLLLTMTLLSFRKTKSGFYKMINKKIETKTLSEDKLTILKDLKRGLKKEMNLKLFNIVDFKIWNFVIIQLLMLLSIAVTVLYQYFNDQIVELMHIVESSSDE